MQSCRPYFKQFNILTLTSLYILELCKFVHKNIYLFPKVRDNISTKMNLRHKDRLALPSSVLEMHSTGPHVMAIKIYNKIPIHIKVESKISKFIKMLKEYLVCKCYYNLKEFYDDFNKISMSK